MHKKLGMTLSMLLLTAAMGARSATLSPTASPALKTGTVDNCPFIPADCCRFTKEGDCRICVMECP